MRRHRRIASAATVSIAFHAAMLGLILLALDHAREPAQRPSDYIYVTMGPAEGRLGSAPPSYHAAAPALRSVPQAEPARRRAAAHHMTTHRKLRSKPIKHEVLAAPVIASGAGTSQFSNEISSNHRTGAAGQQPSGRVKGQGGSPIPGDLVDQPPALLSSVIPDYPEAARDRGIEGIVLLEIVVAKSGSVEHDVTVIESIPSLDQAAITAVRRWRFAPGRQHGMPVRVLLQIPLRFMLQANDE